MISATKTILCIEDDSETAAIFERDFERSSMAAAHSLRLTGGARNLHQSKRADHAIYRHDRGSPRVVHRPFKHSADE